MSDDYERAVLQALEAALARAEEDGRAVQGNLRKLVWALIMLQQQPGSVTGELRGVALAALVEGWGKWTFIKESVRVDGDGSHVETAGDLDIRLFRAAIRYPGEPTENPSGPSSTSSRLLVFSRRTPEIRLVLYLAIRIGYRTPPSQSENRRSELCKSIGLLIISDPFSLSCCRISLSLPIGGC